MNKIILSTVMLVLLISFGIAMGAPAASQNEIGFQQTEKGISADKKFTTVNTMSEPDPDVISQGGDTIADAYPILQIPFTDIGTTAGYNDDYVEACPYTDVGSPDVVYSYEPMHDRVMDITLCGGSDFDTKLYVYENSPANLIICNDDACPGYVSEISELELIAGNIYYIVVDGFNGAEGNYTIDVNDSFVPLPGCQQEVTAPEGNWTFATSDMEVGPYKVFENFYCPTLDFISSMQFWGIDARYDGGWTECDEYPIQFLVEFYEDAGGVPGALLESYFDLLPYRTATGIIYGGVYELIEWDIVFLPHVNLNEGWISIQSTSEYGDGCAFLWGNSFDGDGFAFQEDPIGNMVALPYDLSTGFWCDYCWNPQDSVIWNNGGPTYEDFLICDRHIVAEEPPSKAAPLNGAQTDTLDAWVVDDVTFNKRVNITGMKWWAKTDSSYVFQDVDDIIILTSVGNMPADTLYYLKDVPNTRTYMGGVGNDSLFAYCIHTLDTTIVLDPGTYWFGFRPVNRDSGSIVLDRYEIGRNYWATHLPLTMEQSYFRSEFLGYDEWTPCEMVFGYQFDVSFYIVGRENLCSDVEMIPDDPPVMVPPGDRFGFTGIISNPLADPMVTDVWGGVKYMGSFYRQFAYNNIPLAPGQTLTAHAWQNVPGFAPLGTYTYIAYSGDRPDNPCDSSYFPFTVIAPRLDGGYEDWSFEGGFFKHTNRFGEDVLPTNIILYDAYPNPFNNETSIKFSIPEAGEVTVTVYNIRGQHVGTLVNQYKEAGYHSVIWQASNVPSGIYFYSLQVEDNTVVKRITLLK